MPNTWFTGEAYTTTDGKFSFDLGELPESVIRLAIKKTFDHVFGNESISKAAPSVIENGADRDAVILKARETHHANMLAEKWAQGNRGPRAPGENRLEQIFNMLLARDTRALLKRSPNFKPVEGDNDKWTMPNGAVFTINDAMRSYRDNEKLGASRVADLNAEAQRQLDKETADAEMRKARKAREAAESVPAEGEGLVL